MNVLKMNMKIFYCLYCFLKLSYTVFAVCVCAWKYCSLWNIDSFELIHKGAFFFGLPLNDLPFIVYYYLLAIGWIAIKFGPHISVLSG